MDVLSSSPRSRWPYAKCTSKHRCWHFKEPLPVVCARMCMCDEQWGYQFEKKAKAQCMAMVILLADSLFLCGPSCSLHFYASVFCVKHNAIGNNKKLYSFLFLVFLRVFCCLCTAFLTFRRCGCYYWPLSAIAIAAIIFELSLVFSRLSLLTLCIDFCFRLLLPSGA